MLKRYNFSATSWKKCDICSDSGVLPSWLFSSRGVPVQDLGSCEGQGKVCTSRLGGMWCLGALACFWEVAAGQQNPTLTQKKWQKQNWTY